MKRKEEEKKRKKRKERKEKKKKKKKKKKRKEKKRKEKETHIDGGQRGTGLHKVQGQVNTRILWNIQAFNGVRLLVQEERDCF